MEARNNRCWLNVGAGRACTRACVLLAALSLLFFCATSTWAQNTNLYEPVGQSQAESQSQAQAAAQTPNAQAQASAEPALGPEDIRFYSFLNNIDMMPPGPAAKLMAEHPEFKRWDRGPRLMVQWYFWANQKRPFGQSFLFILFFSVVFWAVAPIVMKTAQSQVRERYWSTFLVGLVGLFVIQTAARSVLRTLIGWPLGIVLVAIEELFLLAGLTVVVSLLGQSIGYFARLEKWPLLGKRSDARRFTELFIGAVICALLLLIPGIGPLPKLGTRLVALLAVLGMGGLYRAWRDLRTKVG